MLVTFSTIGTAKLWDMETFELIQTLRDTEVKLANRERKRNNNNNNNNNDNKNYDDEI